MSTIIKANNPKASEPTAAIDLAELIGRADRHGDWLRGEAAGIIATAKQQAEQIRRQATDHRRREDRRPGNRQDEQWATATAALETLVEQVRCAKQAVTRGLDMTLAEGLALEKRLAAALNGTK